MIFDFNLLSFPRPNYADMISAALDILVPREGGSEGNWDFAGEFIGAEPVPPPQKAKRNDDEVAAEDEGNAAHVPPQSVVNSAMDLGGANMPA